MCKNIFFASIALILLTSCSKEYNINKSLDLFIKQDSESTGIHFTNEIQNTLDLNILNYLPERRVGLPAEDLLDHRVVAVATGDT